VAKLRSPVLFDSPGDAGCAAATGAEAVSLHEARSAGTELALSASRPVVSDVADGLNPCSAHPLHDVQQNLTPTPSIAVREGRRRVMGNYTRTATPRCTKRWSRMAQRSRWVSAGRWLGQFRVARRDNAAPCATRNAGSRASATRLLSEIDQEPSRSDQLRRHPRRTCRPAARIPNLLVNGATASPLALATNIPPHNLRSLHGADQDDRRRLDITSAQLCKVSRAGFPDRGQNHEHAPGDRDIYKTGSGTIRIRATWQEGPSTRSGKTIYITSVPYTVNKSTLVERIAEVALSRKLPHLVDVRDLSRTMCGLRWS